MKTRKIIDTSEWITDDDLKKGVFIAYKGHNIPDDVLRKQLEEDWGGYVCWEGDNDTEEILVLEKKEGYYYTCRYQNGEDAREEGYKCWIEFVDDGKQKKTHGKYTDVKIKIINTGEVAKDEV